MKASSYILSDIDYAMRTYDSFMERMGLSEYKEAQWVEWITRYGDLEILSPLVADSVERADQALHSLQTFGTLTDARKVRIGLFEKAKHIAVAVAKANAEGQLVLGDLNCAVQELGVFTRRPFVSAIPTHEDSLIELAIRSIQDVLAHEFISRGGKLVQRKVIDARKRRGSSKPRFQTGDSVRLWTLRLLYRLAIDDADYNIEENGKIRACPTNETLSAIFDGRRASKYRIRDIDIMRHLRREVTLYYRGNLYKKARTGFGQSEQDAPDFAKDLGIVGKSKTYQNKRMLLIAIDIDYKSDDGQSDAENVADWLVQEHFPGAYHETSTGGNGRHMYIWMGYHHRKWFNIFQTQVSTIKSF